MKRLLYIAMLAEWAAMACAQTGWTTNVWPSYDHPRAAKQQLTDLYYAIRERSVACQQDDTPSGLPTFPSAFRGGRSVITSMKTSLSGMLPLTFENYGQFGWAGFCQTNLSSSGDFNAYYASKGPFPNDSTYDLKVRMVPQWSNMTCIAQHLKMPTNFLTYTPYRDLSGIGGHTNDTSVGRPHGYTNAFTEAGGTNYPVGRSTWYTTDYGIDGVYRIVKLFQWTQDGRFSDPGGYFYYGGGNATATNYNDGTWSKSLEQIWAEAKAQAEANYPAGGGWGASVEDHYGTASESDSYLAYNPPGVPCGTQYIAYAGMQGFKWEPSLYDLMPTGIAHRIEGYHAPLYDGDGVLGNTNTAANTKSGYNLGMANNPDSGVLQLVTVSDWCTNANPTFSSMSVTNLADVLSVGWIEQPDFVPLGGVPTCNKRMTASGGVGSGGYSLVLQMFAVMKWDFKYP